MDELVDAFWDRLALIQDELDKVPPVRTPVRVGRPPRAIRRQQRKFESGRQRQLAKLIKIQKSEMRHENLSRRCGD